MRSIAIYSAIVVLLPFLAHCADIEKLIAERRAEIFAKLKPAQHSNLLSVTHDYDAEVNLCCKTYENANRFQSS